MKKEGNKAELNYFVGIQSSLVSGILMYIERILFVKNMALKEVGFNSLFESSFLLISAFDMGVTTYLMNYLVSSLNTGKIEDERRALSCINKYYRKAILIIFLLGVLTAISMPFLTRREGGFKIACIFIIYLIGQLGDYIFGPKKLYLLAKEKSYLVSLIVHSGRAINSLISILVIVTSGNYFLYVSVSALVTLFTYLVISLKAEHDYPFIKGKSTLPYDKELSIENNLIGMTAHRISLVFFRSFEPILVSILFGSLIEGVYSNYLILSSFFLTPFWIFEQTVTPSIALRCINGDSESNLILYKKISYYNFMFSLFVSFIYLAVLKPYITLSYGREYLMADNWTCIFAFLLFLSSLRTSAIVFRDVEGVYSVDWKKGLWEIISALILSCVLSRIIGLIGIPVGFIITYITIVLWREKKTVLQGSLFPQDWSFVAKETFLMALGLVGIVLVWYLEFYFTFPLSIFASIVFFFLFILIWLLLDKDPCMIMKRKNGVL